jgi:predicted dinucleotide-binding enzyme
MTFATGAHVVKALHLFAGASWPFTGEPAASPVVAICGDDAGALSLAETLIADLGRGRRGWAGSTPPGRPRRPQDS